MSITAPQIKEFARGDHNSIDISWSGELKSGDKVVSCTVASTSNKPTGAADLTLGSVSVNVAILEVNKIDVPIGEATSCPVTVASDQTAGTYWLEFIATSTNGKILHRFFRVNVMVP